MYNTTHFNAFIEKITQRESANDASIHAIQVEAMNLQGEKLSPEHIEWLREAIEPIINLLEAHHGSN